MNCNAVSSVCIVLAFLLRVEALIRTTGKEIVPYPPADYRITPQEAEEHFQTSLSSE